MSASNPSAELLRLVNGYRVSQALHVVATLDIADRLAGGSRTADELARQTGTHADTLYRLLRAVAAIGVLHEDAEQRFSLTPLGEGLRSDASEGVKDWAVFVGQAANWSTWGQLLHTVRTGENAFRFVHGTDAWKHREIHAEDGKVFDRAMMGISRTVTGAIAAAYDFSCFNRVVDVGGGRGALLKAILDVHAGPHGVLFDQPHVVRSVGESLRGSSLGRRLTVVGGNFFEHVPPDADAYLLKSVLHNWDDASASTILRNCAAAMSPHARLILIERLVGPPNETADTKFTDLHMMISPGGRERSRAEFEALLAATGLKLERVVSTGTWLSIIEAGLKGEDT
jgi:O-methyltransferase domain/Dimerisation domain